MTKLKIKRVRTELNLRIFIAVIALSATILFIAYKIGANNRAMNGLSEDIMPAIVAGLFLEGVIAFVWFALVSVVQDLFHKKTYTEVVEVIK